MAKTLKSIDVLQAWFVWSAATFYIAQFVQTVVIYAQIPEPQRSSDTYVTWFAMHAVIAFFWVGVWLTKRKRGFSTPVLFDTTLVTFTLLLVMWAVSTVPILFPSLTQEFASTFLLNAFMFGAPFLVVLPVGAGLILHLRRTKQW